MDKMLSVSQCKLGEVAMDQYYSATYGLTCKNNIDKYLSLFLWAYQNSCVSNTGKDCSGTPLCNLENILGKLTKHCKDCKFKKYKKAIIEVNTDYACWYDSDEYMDCLNWELINNGYIEPAIDLCQNLEIEISIERLCKEIVTYISMNQIQLNTLNVEKAVKNILNINNK
ncbi:MAG TPA: hypothetical protein PKD00_08795 [Burkholderiales bacterium]|nr:hypothetical protein [Burkholderiales bacterium]